MKPILDQAFWSDADIEASRPGIKLTALWLITNPQTNLLGVCGASPGRFEFETKLKPNYLEEAIQALPRAFKRFGGVVFVRNYIRHQFGTGEKLIRNNFFVALKSLFLCVKDEELRDFILSEYPEFQQALAKGLEGLVKPKISKEKKSKDGEREILQFLNEKSGRDFRLVSSHLDPIRSRLSESGVTLDGCRVMIERQVKLWKGTAQEEYLRPSTLFGKEKFASYYDCREQPISSKGKNGHAPKSIPSASEAYGQ